ncbi:MAG: hypothetical protein ABI699_08580 [Caldimonas sp.]
MNVNKLAIVSVALAGVFAATAVQARDRGDARWSVTIGSPAWSAQRAPAYVLSHGDRHGRAYDPRGDADRDGIPNRYDPVYSPPGDRDGDGIPNRYDRVYNPRGDRDGDGIPNRRDRLFNPPGDRDGDGIADRYDRHDRYDNHRHGRAWR